MYHSEVSSEGEAHACGCALLPLNTKSRGPAKRTEGAATRVHALALQPASAAAPRSRGARGAGEDIIDEAIAYFRANVLFRKYDVKGAANARPPLARGVLRSRRALTRRCAPAGSSDKLLIYLTLFISACLRKLESAPTLAAGQKAVFNLAVEPFALPGDAGWPLGGLFTPPATREEAGARLQACMWCNVVRAADALRSAQTRCART